MLNVGDLVVYIKEESKADMDSGYYPTVGTVGTVCAVTNVGCVEVLWVQGTKGDGRWFADESSVVKINGWPA